MSLEDVRSALRSDASMVYVEAPAGCGKTHEAAALGVDVAQTLGENQRVLLLAHTNAAVREFRSRAASAGAPIHATTLDSFALELVAPRARAFGLPDPLRPGDGPDAVPFQTIMKAAAELLSRSPTIARSIGLRFPILIFDEHQDASDQQHALLRKLKETAGCRVRVFADPMQAIFAFSGDLVDCESVAAEADMSDSLFEPRRWDEVPELGEWLLAARAALVAGKALPIDTRPPCVQIYVLPDLPNIHPKFDAVPYQMMSTLEKCLTVDGSLAVLVPTRANCQGMRGATKHEIPIYEGSDIPLAHEVLRVATGKEGDPVALSKLAVELIEGTSIGFTKVFREQVASSITPDGIQIGRKEKIRTFLEKLADLYERPDLETWVRVVKDLPDHLPEGVRVAFPETFRAVGAILIGGEGDYRDLLTLAIRQRRDFVRMPERIITTVHKSKGHEFDHVVVAPLGSGQFPDEASARKLLYVALTRARKSVALIVPGESPSPLLG